MNEKLHIPIIVLNWNGLEDTIQCVAHLKKQTYTDFHIHLIDNNSEDNQKAGLKQHYEKDPKVSLYFNEKNDGFALAHNRMMASLLEESKYKYIALLNNDAFAHPEWLEKLVELAEKEDLDMVGSLMLQYHEKRKIDNFGHQLLNTMEVLPKYYDVDVSKVQSDEMNFGICAGAALYGTKMLKEIGLFDLFFDTGYEDAELGMRAVTLGYKTKSCSRAVVHHVGSASINKIKDEKYVTKTQVNIFYSYLKLMPLSIILINLPFIIFKYTAVALVNLFTGRTTFRRVLFNALKWTIQHREIWQKSRTEFYSKYRPISFWRIQKKMTFFLVKDIQRFIDLVARRKSGYFDDGLEK